MTWDLRCTLCGNTILYNVLGQSITEADIHRAGIGHIESHTTKEIARELIRLSQGDDD